MKIVSIEPTPSPNTMKIILDSELPFGTSHNYKKENHEGAPAIILEILKIDGIKGVYHVADFLALERNAKFDWKDLLPSVRNAFGEAKSEHELRHDQVSDHYGEINVQVQMFKGIPLQVKLSDGSSEKRFGMPESFLKAREQAQLEGDNYILLRKWQDFGVRYGEFEQIGHEVVEELLAAYPSERLNSLVMAARETNAQPEEKTKPKRRKLTLDDLDHSDWRVRYQLLEQMDDPEISDLPLLEKALKDEKASIRRLATVYIGMVKDESALPLLYAALKDKTVTVRRTAGDCLSDLGFAAAEDAMAEALSDESKLVRWRAAMFLYEEGTDKSLASLKAAENDREFEVSLQIKMAIERIEGGMEAQGSVWKQMTEARKREEQS